MTLIVPCVATDLAKPVIYWTPIIAPGNLTFYNGAMFPQRRGSALVSGLATQTLNRMTFDGKGEPRPPNAGVSGTAFATPKSVRTARCGCSRTPIPAGCSV